MIRRQQSSAIGAHANSVNTGITPARRNSTVDSSGRFCALPTENGQPECLVSLCYLDQSQKVVVAVEKASNLCHDCTDKVSGELSIALKDKTSQKLLHNFPIYAQPKYHIAFQNRPFYDPQYIFF